ncbi:MAG: CPBP family intramembrane glutamic endopeptidase [Candidatus Heimdallarchaeaceae archaeon]
MEKKKMQNILEALLSLVVLVIIILALAHTELMSIQLEYLYGDYLDKIIAIVFVITIVLVKKEKLSSYGLSINNWKSNLQLGFLISFLSILPIIVPIATGWNAIIEIPNPYFLHFSLIYYFVFVSFSEELLFRGFIQTKLNQSFKSLEFRNFEIKWGTIITAFLFAICHVVRVYIPFMGHVQIILSTFPSAFCFGLLVGIIKDETGSLIAPILIHGILDVFLFIDDDFTLLNDLVMMLIWIFIFILFIKISSVKMKKHLSNTLASFESSESKKILAGKY